MGTSDAGDVIHGLDAATQSNGEVLRFADKAMYEAEPMADLAPKVRLLWMTPDPLGAMAAMSGMYEGKVHRSLLDVTDEERMKSWNAMQETHLTAPLESVKLHFLIEGVDRAFTHQLVRQRTAVYAQESLRFAVKSNLKDETPKPPSFSDPRVVDSPSKRNDLDEIWDRAMDEIHRAYRALIASGVPAEDARGLLPTATLTRIHYITDLRNLLEHAGNRLCTQAQFHWRTVFMQIREEIRNYWQRLSEEDSEMAARYLQWKGDRAGADEIRGSAAPEGWAEYKFKAWQFKLIADNGFKPQCYIQGKCPFKADFDRGCTIRGRVDMFAHRGVPSKLWGDENVDHYGPELSPIDDAEWASDPQAAWLK